MIADGVRVQCIVTSPPYWGLRDYGVPGAFGLERTWVRHLARMRYVFRLCRQLLTEDGVLWLNYGDAYYSPRVNGGIGVNSKINGQGTQEAYRDAQRARNSGKQLTNAASPHASAMNRRHGQPGIKPKDLLGMPWTLALLLRADGWWLRSDVIWHKSNPMPESIGDRPTKSHEYLFMMSRSEVYYSDFDAIKEVASTSSSPRTKMPDGWDTGSGAHGSFHREGREKGASVSKQQASGDPRQQGFNERWRARQNGPVITDQRKALRTDTESRHRSSIEGGQSLQAEPDGMRNVRTVWTIPTEPFPGAHFATFPQALVRRCIAASTRPGDVVLDPFMGSGTVAQVADSLGRRFIGCEVNPEYAAMYGRERKAQLGMAL